MRIDLDEYVEARELDNGTLSDNEKELIHKIRRVCIDHGLIATEDLENEIFFRCESLETETFEGLEANIWACIMYALVNGYQALVDEEDDCNIWQFIG